MNERYFIDKLGCLTRRMAGASGQGHIESAATSGEALDPDGDIYQQMFRLGYVRVMETDTELFVDSPRRPTAKQREALSMRAERGSGLPTRNIIYNAPDFIKGRQQQ